eukprot:scaffold5400_cov169-Amphora_coffeaeformis.AAC.4
MSMIMTSGITAFQPPPIKAPAFRQRLGTALMQELRGVTNEEIIKRLQEEYQALQRELFAHLAVEDKKAAEHVSEEMLTKAADLTQVQEYQTYLALQDSAQHMEQAHKDVEIAKDIASEAHSQALMADYRRTHARSMDEALDLNKRGDAWAKVHQAHSAEDFASKILTETQFEELQAELDYDNAEQLWRDLKENEQLLQRSLEQMRHKTITSDHWLAQEAPKHEEFLDQARHVIRSGKLIDHDPTKGDVAF